MTRDTQRARRDRTIQAPNGARVVMPRKTTAAQMMAQLLDWYFIDPTIKAMIEHESDIARLFTRPLGSPALHDGGLYFEVRHVL